MRVASCNPFAPCGASLASRSRFLGGTHGPGRQAATSTLLQSELTISGCCQIVDRNVATHCLCRPTSCSSWVRCAFVRFRAAFAAIALRSLRVAAGSIAFFACALFVSTWSSVSALTTELSAGGAPAEYRKCAAMRVEASSLSAAISSARNYKQHGHCFSAFEHQRPSVVPASV